MRTSAAVVLLSVLAMVIAIAPVEAQDCTQPPTAGTTSTWAQGTKVTVYVDPVIPGWDNSAYRSVMRSTFDAWDHIGGSDVSFAIVADASRAHNPPANSIGIIQDNRSTAGLRPGAVNLHSAIIRLDDFSPNPEEMRSQLAHEIGHTFGLDHCPACAPGTSVMAAGGAAAPSPCDRAAVKENGGYFGIDIGGGRGGRPGDCQNCGVQNCTVTLLCRCPNGDCRVREGRLVGDWSCTEMGRTCIGGGGCCRGDTSAPGSASGAVCDGWNRASECEWGSVCCFDPAANNPIEPPTCDAMGWYDYWETHRCEEVSGTTCTPAVLLGFSNWETTPLTRECLQPSVGSIASNSCGAMGGDYCSQNGGCPAGFVALPGSSDCNPCCKAGPSCGAMGGTYCSPTRTCPDEYTAIGRSFDCRMCCTDAAAPPPPPPTPTPPPAGPSCGELGGDFCSPTKTCPEGYELLGRSYDCVGCCRQESVPPPPPPTPTPPPAGPSCGEMGGDYCSPDGSCPGGYDWLGVSYDCSACCRTSAPPPPPPPTPTPPPAGPSCGEMGGDYCSPDGSCPGGYDWLGVSYDCSACCRTSAPPPPPPPTPTPPPAGPSCGEMGGDYCSPDGSCPGGYDWLGVSYDCSACCLTSAPPPPPPAGPSCGDLGGDYCSQNGSCPDGYEWLGQSADCQQCCRMAPDQQP